MAVGEAARWDAVAEQWGRTQPEGYAAALVRAHDSVGLVRWVGRVAIVASLTPCTGREVATGHSPTLTPTPASEKPSLHLT